ncbi:MAG: dihydrodipicolinate reductase C-terminal domain-containing protein, partial [Nocardioides sp.]
MSTAIKVGVLGARGRVGSEVCRAVDEADGVELVARVDDGDPLDDLTAAEVVVDFTHPDVVMDNLRWCLAHGLHCVVGTTGFDDARLDQLRAALTDTPGLGVLVAPNFSIGAVLMMRFAAAAAPFYESVEIVELHHPDKVDAPSGTARELAHRLSLVRPPEPTVPVDETVGEREARGATLAGTQVHSVRLPG